MKNLIVHVPALADGSSFYRIAGPISEIRKKHQDFQIVPMQKGSYWSWSIISMGDAFLMHRPWHETDLEIAKLIKDQGKPLWIDYDDDLTSIPLDNPCHQQYKGCEDTVVKIVSMADVVTVSTEYLRQKYIVYNKNVKKIPNAFNFKMFEGLERGERKKHVMWRGSETHQRDLLTYKDEIISLILDPDLKDYKWFFMGYMPWFIQDAIKKKDKVFLFPQKDPVIYHKLIHAIEPTLTFVPLHGSDFNLAKSNCAWLESTFAGSITVAPDWHEWRRPGIKNYGSPQRFYDAMKQNLLEPDEMDYVHSLEDMKNNFSLEKSNIHREKILYNFGVIG